MGKKERQDRRAARREKLAKLAFSTVGLKWSDNDELRAEAWDGGVQAVRDAGLIDADTFSQLKNLGASIAAGNLSGIPAALDVIKTRDEILRVFGEVWDAIILRGPVEPEPAPRAQVDIAAVAGALPWQAAAMVSGAKKATPWWYFAIPAGLLFFILQRGR